MSGGNLKSIGGNGVRRGGGWDEPPVLKEFTEVFAVEVVRLDFGRPLSAFRFPGDGLIGDFVGGRPRRAFRPAKQQSV